MKLSPKWLLIPLFACVTIILTGCSGVGESDSERSYHWKRQMAAERHMIVDDWDAFWMKDRTSRLSEYSIRE